MHRLQVFEETDPINLSASLQEADEDLLKLTFQWNPSLGEIDHQRIAHRRQNLWESTCFECFVMHEDGSYIEWNFSLNGDWNCFQFSKYREALSPWERPLETLPIIKVRQGLLEVIFGKTAIKSYQISAIICLNNDTFHYALEHPNERPDFHKKKYFQQWSHP